MINVGLDYGGREYVPIPLPIISGTNITEVMNCAFCENLFLQVTIGGLGSGESLDLTVEGSLTGDSAEFDNLSATDETTTVSTNGANIIRFPGAITPYVRVVINGWLGSEVSEATYSIVAYVARMS